MPEANRRERYRLEYPRSERPSFLVAGRRLEVIECSESGLCYAVPAREPPPPVGSQVRGVVDLHGRHQHEVEGAIQRVHDGLAVLRFTHAGIPFGTILAEQKYLRAHFIASAASQ